MDNLCHTLVGAALAEAGLKRRTRYGSATLMIASNLPDIDVLVFATSTPSVAFRRGWTHGILADLVPADPVDARHPSSCAPVTQGPPRCQRRSANPAGTAPVALVHRCDPAHPDGRAEQLRRPPADALQPALVLRRCPVHHRSLAVDCSRGGRLACTAPAFGGRRRAARWCLRRRMCSP